MNATALEIFYTLKENNTFIRLRIPRIDYERIVVVSDIRTNESVPLIAIDCPDEMRAALETLDQTEVVFEFTGEDQINYRFTTDNGFISDNTIWIEVPAELERNQRRRDFRITAPMDALFYFTAGDKRKRVKMMDLSLGGASGLLISIKHGIQQQPPVKIGQTILNLKLEFTTDGKRHFLPVRECVVRRIENLPQKGRYLMAVAFTRMDEEHRARLRKIIYTEQRHLLKIRQQRQ